ncbi:hypothetical protein M9H77_05486 [Catharanthus roseus]|uniref:Uncharacterized protein n=1 Tax=Catharanthus roseus TaxID=4058 RepID=A0ACC0CHH4_CATRO|nr:hypothetical protein M9H77_05486 [Catharanthus roseus]
MQLHIRLMLLVSEDPVKVHTLKECLSGVEDDFLEQLDDGANGYENLSFLKSLPSSTICVTKFLIASKFSKLQEVRAWIDDQASEQAEQYKEEKGLVRAAKGKEKPLETKCATPGCQSTH